MIPTDSVLSKALPIAPRSPVFVQGWVVIGAAFLSMFFTGPGQTYSYALFINSILSETGWTRAGVSTLYSAATTISGLLMFIVGRLVDRYGSRTVNIIALAMLGLTCLFSSFVVNPAMLFAAFFFGRFFGQGTLGVSSGTVAPNWFRQRRALAIMIVGLGNTVAAMVYPRLNHWLIVTYGWRNAFRYLGATIWIIGLPVVILLLRSKPEDRGLRPDGAAVPAAGEAEADDSLDEYSFGHREAIRTKALWFLAFTFFQFAMVGTGITFHYVSILNGAGFSDAFAAKVMSLSPIAGVLATVLLGFVMDRVRRPQLVLAASCLVQFATILILAYMKRESAAYLYTILSGISGAVSMLSVAVLKPHLFGRRYIGSISGIISVVVIIGSAIGPLYFGAAYDSTGGYRGTLLVSALFPAIATVVALLLRKPRSSLAPPDPDQVSAGMPPSPPDLP